MHLTYVFVAYFDSTLGHTRIYAQTQDDSAYIADYGTAFTDVLHLQEIGAKLLAFALHDAETNTPVAAVHLDTGHFELGGNEFYAGVEGLDDPAIERRLVYFRQVQQIRSQEVDTATGEAVNDWREETRIRYVIGWQATVNGANVQHMIALDG